MRKTGIVRLPRRVQRFLNDSVIMTKSVGLDMYKQPKFSDPISVTAIKKDETHIFNPTSNGDTLQHEDIFLFYVDYSMVNGAKIDPKFDEISPNNHWYVIDGNVNRKVVNVIKVEQPFVAGKVFSYELEVL